MELKFRPHHFLCALCFQGKGYSLAFVRNFQKIMDRLHSDDQINITVTGVTDSICTPCPSRRDTLCLSEETINTLDNAHAAALEIKPNDMFSWKEAKQIIAEKITLETFHKICAPCSWKKLGICETILTKHLEQSAHSLNSKD